MSHREGRGSGIRAFAVAFVLGLISLVLAPLVSAGPDYIPTPPPTLYEDPVMSPQTMGYDAANRTFIAHPGWINDRLIHYYKFRMYTPMTYPDRIRPGQPPDIPIGEMYLLSTTNDFAGIVAGQKPVLRWHTADGESYSDFVEVVWATVGPSYVADTYRSYGDLVENGTPFTRSGVYANVPVVPTGSRLQDPSGVGFSPILPMMVWYRGVEVQTFVFETTSPAFADHFNPITRSGTAGQVGSGYEITTAQFVSGGTVSFIPIWHLNQYWRGVQAGVNSGGPWGGGQRNVINLDRGIPGYSPLWQVYWVSAVPVDYSADMASSSSQISEANGFRVAPTPMFVNCPNVGSQGGVNPRKATSFERAQVGPGETVRVAGALVMEADIPVDAYVGGAKIASTRTAMMGAYEFVLPTDGWPDGSVTITVKDASGNVLLTTSLTKASGLSAVVGDPAFIGGIVLAVALVAAALLLMRRRRRASGRGAEPRANGDTER